MNYININKKKLVGRNNQICTLPIVFDYSTVEEISFQLINDQNQIQPLDGMQGLYFAASLSIGQQSYDLLFLCKDYIILNDVLTFKVDTYTRNYLDKIKKKNTEVNIEIGQISLDVKKVILRDYALACPRVYVTGLSPQEIESNDYYTKEEVDELIEDIHVPTKLSDLENDEGFVTAEYIDGQLSGKQDLITNSNKLDYVLLSGTPTIPTKTSDLQNDSGFITDSTLTDYQKKITVESKLDYALLSGTPTIPTKTSDLQNDSSFQTAQDVQTAISGKADESALLAHTTDTTIHVTSADKNTWNEKLGPDALTGYATENYVDGAVSGKQDLITNSNKLDYVLLSGTPTIPTKTSDLQNDSGFITDSALTGKQDLITSTNKLDYALLSGVPAEPNPVNVSIEIKTALSAGTFNTDFTGKQIQKYSFTDATSGTVSITYDAFVSTANDIAPTVELHIPVNGEVTTISLPSGAQVIDIPDTLSYSGQTANDVEYHAFVLRAEKDVNGTWQYYINYAYSYIETQNL